METKLIQCRIDGFFEHCDHPFASDDSKAPDVNAPFHADFVIFNEPFTAPHSPDIQNFPLFVLGVAPIFNIPDLPQLILSRKTLADIFRGSITSWNDNDIKSTNPANTHAFLDAAGDIKVIIREDPCAATQFFRSALSQFSMAFANQIGKGNTNAWNGTSFIKYFGDHGVFNGVSSMPGSISYVKISMRNEQEGVELVQLLNEEALAVAPNTESLYAAFQEIGLAFGNDGSNPSRLSIDLTGALGRRGWPIAQIGYLAFKVDEDSEFCVEKRTSMLSFFEYLYTHEGFGSDLFKNGFAPLTIQAGAEVLSLIREKLKCNGSKIYQEPPPKPLVTIQVDESLKETVQLMGDEFSLLKAVRMEIGSLDSHLEIKRRFNCLGNISCNEVSGGLILLADENLSNYIIRDDRLENGYALFSMPYCAMVSRIYFSARIFNHQRHTD
jgi:ABC-type phosphate transport system substrate-binding protein